VIWLRVEQFQRTPDQGSFSDAELYSAIKKRVQLDRIRTGPWRMVGAWAWKSVVPLLEKKVHSVYPATLTGMGDRVHLASNEVGMETAVQDVLNVIKYNDIDDFVLVGHSFAGKVAAAVADRASEKVKLVLYLDAFRPEKVENTAGGIRPHQGIRSPPPGELRAPSHREDHGEHRKGREGSRP